MSVAIGDDHCEEVWYDQVFNEHWAVVKMMMVAWSEGQNLKMICVAKWVNYGNYLPWHQ